MPYYIVRNVSYHSYISLYKHIIRVIKCASSHGSFFPCQFMCNLEKLVFIYSCVINVFGTALYKYNS